jgi:hypothetical protein
MIKLTINTTKCNATALFENNTLVIQKGSRGWSGHSPSFRKIGIEKRNILLKKGIIKIEGESLLFCEDYKCKSPSEGSNLLSGNATNGLVTWKDRNGKTLKWLLRD